MEKLPGRVKVRKEKFGSVIFDATKEKVYVTNEVGGQIIKMMKDDKTIDEIADCLSKQYDCSLEIIKKDVMEFSEELRKAGFLEEIKKK